MSEKEFEDSNPRDYHRTIQSGISLLKPFLNSLHDVQKFISRIENEGLFLDNVLRDVMIEYFNIHRRLNIDTKIKELENAKKISFGLHLALLNIERGEIPVDPIWKTSEAGQYLYSLYGKECSKDTGKRRINELINRTDGTELKASAPPKGVDKRIYKSDIDKWYIEFGSSFNPR
jgi:hypothetical protein